MLSFEQLVAGVREALRAKLGDSYSTPGWTIIATFQDAVIVARGATQLERYSVAVDLFDKVTLGEAPEAVSVAYQALKEAKGSLILGPLAEAADGKKEWACLVIEEGTSANRRHYPAETLRAAVKLFEGVQCYFTHTASTQAEPDPRDIAGFLRAPQFALLEATKKSAILATFRSTAARATELLTEAFDAGHPGLVGLSINASGKGQIVRLAEGGSSVYRVDSIDEVDSVDIVAKPAAGGRFLRLVAGVSSPVPVSEEDLVMFEKKLKMLREGYPALAAKLSASPTEAEVDVLLLEAATPKPAVPPTPAPTPAPAATPAAEGLTDADRTLLHEARVGRAMAGRTFGPLEDLARETMARNASAPEAELVRIAEAFVQKAAKLVEAPKGSGVGATLEVRQDEADKLLEAADGFYMHGASPAVAAEYEKITGHKPPAASIRSIRSLYEAFTGDVGVTGQLREARGLTRFNRLLETIQVATFANLWANVQNKRMLAEYRAAEGVYTNWRRVVSSIVPLRDYKLQSRMRWGSFADLPAVGELAPYQELANPTDELVQYQPSKRGGLVAISREAILNDDVGMVQRLPRAVAFAALRTLNTFVSNLIATNPLLDDGVALFAAAVTRGFTAAGNLIVTPLSQANVSVARQRLLRVQDRDGNTMLGLAPYILVVPPELEELGWRLTSIPMAPIAGQNATEPNVVAQRYGLRELIVQPTLTDANNWFIMADPRTVETIEMGFVGGQEEPELFVQDQPNNGAMFTADRLTWKVRHEYGGDVVEWRGMIGGIVP